MSLFGNKIEAANAQIGALMSMLALVGYKPADASQATAEGFNAALTAHVKTVVDTAVATVNTERDTARADVKAFTDGLKGAGIAVEFAAEQTTPEARTAAVKTAVDKFVSDAVAKKAASAVASAGHIGALDTSSKDAGGSDASATPTSAEEFLKVLNSISDPGKRQAYSAKHLNKFIS